MELTWTTVLLLLAATFVAWFWQESLRVRDAANSAAMEACTRMSLQFLDGTVAFSHLRLVRDEGRLSLRRTYVFDYTSQSIDRLQGFVVLLGRRVESVGFAKMEQRAAASDSVYPPTPTHPPSPPSPRATALIGKDRTTNDHIGSPAADDKVLDLETWRKSRQR